MKITQYAQSGTIITSEAGETLAIDIGSLSRIATLSNVCVDYALVSHIHPDHCSAAQLEALSPKMVFTGSECVTSLQETTLPLTTIHEHQAFSAGEFYIEVFAVDHGPDVSHTPEQNFGFLITVDEKTIYFAGDMYTPSGIPVTELEVDAALLPVGGHFTMDAEAAFAFAKTFKRITAVYPIHYEAVGPIDTHGGDAFRKLAKNTFTVATKVKTIFIDAIHTLYVKQTDGTADIDSELLAILNTYPQHKVILTNANEEEATRFGLTEAPYAVFTMQHKPDKTDSKYYQTVLDTHNLVAGETMYFEHNQDAVQSAQSVGITTFQWNKNTRPYDELTLFLEDSTQNKI